LEKIINSYKILVSKFEGNRLFERLMHRWNDNIKMDFKRNSVRVWTRFNCFSTTSSTGISLTWWWTFGFHRKQGTFWPFQQLPASKGLCSMELQVIPHQVLQPLLMPYAIFHPADTGNEQAAYYPSPRKPWRPIQQISWRGVPPIYEAGVLTSTLQYLMSVPWIPSLWSYDFFSCTQQSTW